MRVSTLSFFVLALGAASCVTQPRGTGTEPAPPPTTPDEARPTGPAPAPPQGPAAGGIEIDPTSRVLVMDNGAERWISAAEAETGGYTIVDLSDDFTPFIFAEHHTPDGAPLPNRYRRVFIGLANDQLDEDGQPLAPGAKNYLELYGIFPSLSVLRNRFLADEERLCLSDEEKAALAAVESVAYIPPERRRREEARLARVRQEVEKARRRVKAKTWAELVEREPKQAANVKLLEKRAAEKLAMPTAEKRLACEGFLGPGSGHKQGQYDDAMRSAVRSFQQKHMIYEAHYLRRETMDALERRLIDNNHRALLRVLRERVVAAAGILEDGTTGSATWRTASGERRPIGNLAEEYTNIAAGQLGLDTPEKALAFFRKRGDFQRLRAGVKLPARPEYYGPQMDLSIVIDRGDVWYDLPWDETGERKPQPRRKYPSFTLFVRHRGQRIPLVRWRTTVGGWRSEQASDGYEYYRYKGSDVGPRVMRQIIAGPVWIAPASTPIRSLVKAKRVGRQNVRVVNYDELGPGYLSAYGLVAGYFVVPGQNGRPDFDNGIRAHGSSDYLSIYSSNGFSHGCHRLPNHLAIRLYSFVLRHRTMRVVGDLPLNFARQFLRDQDVFEIRIPSRGYAFQMDPPLPIDVQEGEIKGEEKEPILTYVPKPGVRYPGPPPPVPNSPEARAGGGAGPAKKSDEKGEEPEEATP